MNATIDLLPEEVKFILKTVICNHHCLDVDKAVMITDGDMPHITITMREEIYEGADQ